MNAYKLGGNDYGYDAGIQQQVSEGSAPRGQCGRHRSGAHPRQGRQPRAYPGLRGDLIAKKHGGIEETITVRRVSYGVGVEKVFPIHAPTIEKIETVRKGKVRRAKLYYLRDRMGKSAKVKERI